MFNKISENQTNEKMTISASSNKPNKPTENKEKIRKIYPIFNQNKMVNKSGKSKNKAQQNLSPAQKSRGKFEKLESHPKPSSAGNPQKHPFATPNKKFNHKATSATSHHLHPPSSESESIITHNSLYMKNGPKFKFKTISAHFSDSTKLTNPAIKNDPTQLRS